MGWRIIMFIRKGNKMFPTLSVFGCWLENDINVVKSEPKLICGTNSTKLIKLVTANSVNLTD